MSSPAAPLLEYAPAKINLTLRVLGRRADGFHELDSLVVFARTRDALTLRSGDTLGLMVRGPTAGGAGAVADNLVLKSTKALAASIPQLRLGQFILIKRIPVAAGLGGGSADAAAALRLLARANGIALDDPRLAIAAASTGSDVPVCVSSRARMMRGRGETLSQPLRLPRIPAILVNCGVAVATRDVFAALAGSYSRKGADPDFAGLFADPVHACDRNRLIDAVTHSGNDLERPAIALCPAIAEALAVLRALPRCRLARMSGSGATCFALFDTEEAAGIACRILKQRQPTWWARATTLG